MGVTYLVLDRTADRDLGAYIRGNVKSRVGPGQYRDLALGGNFQRSLKDGLVTGSQLVHVLDQLACLDARQQGLFRGLLLTRLYCFRCAHILYLLV